MREGFEIAGQRIPPGGDVTVDIPLGVLSNHTPLSLPVHVIHGRRPGPVLFISAAIHGDEILGVEIIRRLVQIKDTNRPRGTLLFVPIVNVYGFLSHSRYLPDRRDLNRSFPGSAKGSLAGQLAHVFMTEIVKRSDYGIDLHTAAVHRDNLPQIRANLSDPTVKAMAEIFAAPVTLDGHFRDGSLRKAAMDVGVPVLLYEAGEALRFNESAVRFGVKGILRVMHHLGMISRLRLTRSRQKPVLSNSSHWLRAPSAGLLRAVKGLGDAVVADEVIGYVSDPFGYTETELCARSDGIVIGRANLPVVNAGDALFHVDQVFDPSVAVDRVGNMEQELGEDELAALEGDAALTAPPVEGSAAPDAGGAHAGDEPTAPDDGDPGSGGEPDEDFEFEGDFGDPKLWEAEFWSLRHHLTGTLFDGMYPVFPWMAFLLVGMAVVRIGLDEARSRRRVLVGATLATAATYGAWWAARAFDWGEGAELLTDVDRFAAMPGYLVASAGQAVILLCLALEVAERWPRAPWLPALCATGQLTFSVYIFRIFIGGGDRSGLFDWLGFADGSTRSVLTDGWIRVAIFVPLMVLACHLWAKRFGRGPLEWAMRRYSDR